MNQFCDSCRQSTAGCPLHTPMVTIIVDNRTVPPPCGLCHQAECEHIGPLKKCPTETYYQPAY